MEGQEKRLFGVPAVRTQVDARTASASNTQRCVMEIVDALQIDVRIANIIPIVHFASSGLIFVIADSHVKLDKQKAG